MFAFYSIFIDRRTGNVVKRVHFLFGVLPSLLKPKEARSRLQCTRQAAHDYL